MNRSIFRRPAAKRVPLRGVALWTSLAIAVTAFVLPGLHSGADRVAAAGESSTEILSHSVVSKLPDGIEFTANVAGDVEEITARFSIQGRRATQYDYLDFGEPAVFTTTAPANGLLFYKTDTVARYLPPGVTMEYRIEVLDSNGDVHESEPSQIVLTDSRFEWETVSSGGVTVYYHGPVTTRANSLLDASLQTIQNMAPVLGIPFEGAPINVTMYNNIAEMIDATVARSGAISRELITEGQAFSPENTVLVLGGSSRSTGTMSHELTHVLLSRAVSGARSSVPAWLNEGLAEYGNIDPGVAYERYLEWGIDTNRIAPLTALSTFPGDPDLVIVSYGQGRAVARFMIEEFGPGKMAELLAEFDASRDFDAAMLQVYGLDRRGLDELWRSTVGAFPLAEEQVIATPTAVAYPTFVPYTLDNLGAAPTSTPAPDSDPEPQPSPSPETVSDPDDEAESGGGGCFAAPGAPVEGGMALIIVAVGSAAALRTVRRKS
ncbi:MAG: peptidase MA family metallohydrolase [Dehalococcoidia bacterium]|nr:peptidase MA family metallohydrolase [Dehalococcoidia bacterium]